MILNGLIKTCKRLIKNYFNVLKTVHVLIPLNLHFGHSSSGSRGVGRRRGLPGTGCRHSAFETDTRGLLAGCRLGTFSFV